MEMYREAYLVMILCGLNPTLVGTTKKGSDGMQLKDIWAKTEPWQGLETHSKVSGIVAQQLLQYGIPHGCYKQMMRMLHLGEQELCCYVGYHVSLHDIGKLSAFQAHHSESREKMRAEGMPLPLAYTLSDLRHEKNTARIMGRIWQEAGMERRTATYLANLLGAHHQGRVGDADENMNRWQALQDELERRLRRYFYGDTAVVWPVIGREDRGAIGALLLGLTILSDWIASSDPFAQAENWGEHLHEQTVQRTRAFLRDSGLERQDLFSVAGFPSVWRNIPREGMRPLQQAVESLFEESEESISLVLLEAPMGEGKTEAGMYAALKMAKQWGKDGFYMALPTAATSNQMVERMRALLAMHDAEKPVRLLHAMAWLVDEEQPNPEQIQTEDEAVARKWLEPLRRGLLSPYAVGTVDQAMMSVLMIKYGVLRLLGLAGKVLVIDELHAYDVYMSSILTCLMQWCKALEIPVVLLSATLPPAKKQQMLEAFTDARADACYPAVTAVTASGKLIERHVSKTIMRRKLRIKCCGILHEPVKIAEKAMELTQNGGCLCVMLNTVKQAQAVYRELKQQCDASVILFHAQFPAKRRDEIETRCLRMFGKDKGERPQKAVLVATQVCEQSLDLDFDIMMTAIAPIDLILQRAGREQRHEGTARPEHLSQPILYVMIPSIEQDIPSERRYGEDGVVYPPSLLAQSEYLLTERQEIRIPEEIQQLVADGYDESKAPPEMLEAWLEQMIEDDVRAQAGEQMTIDDPRKEFRAARMRMQFDDLERDSFLSAKTRLSEPAVRIALLEAELYERVKQYAVREKDGLYAPISEKELARAVLKQSVSIRKKRIQGYLSDLSVIEGRKLLSQIKIFPAEGGCYRAPDGKEIIFDHELGVLLKEGET